MQRLLAILILGTFMTGCLNSGGGGGGGGAAPAPAKPGDGNKPANPGGGNGDLGEPGGTDISCLLYDSTDQRYWIGFGDSTTSAAELGTEVCAQFNKQRPEADCRNVVACEERVADYTWRCTAVNSFDGYKTTSKGRSKLEAFNQANGLCSKGHNASPATCTKFEVATCVSGVVE